MRAEELPTWLTGLEIEDITFIKKFVLASGSLKDMAKEYEVTYPTLRIRLDKLIEKIILNDNYADDSYILKIKSLAIEDKIETETAKLLISEYRKVKKQ